MTDALPLRSRAEAATANLAALLARAEQLAAAVMPGGHGRRRGVRSCEAAGCGKDAAVLSSSCHTRRSDSLPVTMPSLS